jgi:hypothetical protein
LDITRLSLVSRRPIDDHENAGSSPGTVNHLQPDIDALMAVLVWCPWWQDLLKYSAGGRIEEMRRAVPFMESAWMGDEEQLAAARAYLTSGLGIAEPPDPLGALRRAVSMPLDVRFHDQSAHRCSAGLPSTTIRFSGCRRRDARRKKARNPPAVPPYIDISSVLRSLLPSPKGFSPCSTSLSLGRP